MTAAPAAAVALAATAATAGALLPREAGLLFAYSAFGAFGGLVNAAHAHAAAPPSVWGTVRALFVGAGCGFLAGSFCLYKFTADFFLAATASFSLGLLGVPVAQKMLKGLVSKGTP
ncbi:MAG TPA: hypothetical protein VEA69_16945 [Tepidisphaeraceae bacterium]|nr:hypothetical protein [Tepidisphaeraceae bacterium]